ncbi:hypothetical protein HGP17_11250 [Rhizobium sp. P38BS-XIX]|nr:hypothetical protein [Rhizobium sp. P38BS-XIX]NLR97401.1 hypothetical protein [Rhizobium sp. P38BS-XIX]
MKSTTFATSSNMPTTSNATYLVAFLLCVFIVAIRNGIFFWAPTAARL